MDDSFEQKGYKQEAQSSQVADTLAQWHVAHKHAQADWNNDFWDGRAFTLHNQLERRYPSLEAQIQNIDFEQRTELIEYINYDLWLHWRYVILSGDHAGASGATSEYAQKKSKIFPLMEKALLASAEEDRLPEIELVFQGLDNVGEDAQAEQLLYLDDLDEKQRLRVTVGYINQFGFIAGIDQIARKIADPKTSDTLRHDLQGIYTQLQAEEAKSITVELEEIYNRVNFSEYALNAVDLTNREVDILEDVLKGLGEKDNVRILDVGAGVARHSGELSARGYTHVTAFEYQSNHIAYIKDHYPDLSVIQGDWSHLTELTDGKGQYDMTYILGRSATHNRTSSDMMECFDQVQAVMRDGGRGVIDFENIESGARKERVEKLTQTLETLGVRALQGGEIFDGPNDTDRYNRLILNADQVDAMTKLLGLKLLETRTENVAGGDFGNVYYIFEKDQSSDVNDIAPEDFYKLMGEIGMLKPSADYNMYIDAWGVTVGQALTFAFKYGIKNEYMRMLNEKGQGPTITAEYEGQEVFLESHGLNTRDALIAQACRGMSKEETVVLVERINTERFTLQQIQELLVQTR